MKTMKKILSVALVLAMLATCAVQSVFMASAEEAKVINDNNGWGIFTEGGNVNRSGNNIRIVGGKYDNVFLGHGTATYNITSNVTYTFEAGEFDNVYLHSKKAGSISGNIIYNVNGGTFKNGIMMGGIGDYGLAAGSVTFGNIAVIVDGGSENLSLKKIASTGRTPLRLLDENGKNTIGVWMAIVNNCTDATIPTLSGNAGNQTKLTTSTDPKFIDITQFNNGDYNMYVKGGEAQPVFDGTTFKGFTLKSNIDGLVPKVTYNYHRSSDDTIRKAVAYPVADENGVYDLSTCNSGLSVKDNRSNYVTIVEFVPVAEALGASLRFKNSDDNFNGIRFGMKFSQGYVTGANTDAANFGVILMAKSVYDSQVAWTLDELKAHDKARVATGKVSIWDPAAETYTVNAVLYNIPEANYESGIIAIPYIGDTLYTDKAIVRSMFSVAKACVEDENASEEAKAYCQGILGAKDAPTSGT